MAKVMVSSLAKMMAKSAPGMPVFFVDDAQWKAVPLSEALDRVQSWPSTKEVEASKSLYALYIKK